MRDAVQSYRQGGLDQHDCLIVALAAGRKAKVLNFDAKAAKRLGMELLRCVRLAQAAFTSLRATARIAVMDRATVLACLREQAPLLRERFGLRRIALFGSAARDELRADSDIDVLVDFIEPATMARYFGTQDALEALLGRPVDLVTSAGLKPRARAHLEHDLIDVT